MSLDLGYSASEEPLADWRLDMSSTRPPESSSGNQLVFMARSCLGCRSEVEEGIPSLF